MRISKSQGYFHEIYIYPYPLIISVDAHRPIDERCFILYDANRNSCVLKDECFLRNVYINELKRIQEIKF